MEITPEYTFAEFERHARLNLIELQRLTGMFDFSDKVVAASVNASQAAKKNTRYMNALYRARMAA